MKAARIHAYGHSDQVVVEDISQPEPRPNEALIRIRAIGINPIDWKIREGYMAKLAPRTLPFTLGQDFCGEVLALGPAVTTIEAGMEVYGFANGAYAEYAAVSPDMFATKPMTADDAISAALPTPGLTALQLVTQIVQPRKGQTVLIQGAAGAVGSIVTQLCLANGARVIATASRDDADYLTSLGVARVIDYRTERFEDHVRELDAVIDLVGGETFTRSLDVIRERGLIVSTVGPIDSAKDRPVRAERIVMQKNKADLVVLSRLVDQGVVTPRPPRVLRFADARKAQELSQSGKTSQKLVLEFR